MAVTSYGVNDSLTVKLWAKKLFVDALNATEIAPLIGEGSDSIVQKMTDMEKSAGDRVRVGLRMQLEGAGVSEAEALEGNEESLSTYHDDVVINELHHAVRVRNKGRSIDAQRVPFNLRDEARMGLKDWLAKRWSRTFFNVVCGNTATSGLTGSYGTAFHAAPLKFTGFNAATAPSAGRILRPNGQTTDQGVNGDSTAVMTLGQIDRAVEVARTAAPLIRPISVGGEDKYVMYLDESQVTQLRTNTSTGQWLDIQKAAMAGMQSSRSPIFSGALGEYNGVVLRRSVDIPNGVHSTSGAAQTNTRRAVLLGAQAAVIAFAQGHGETGKWTEELFDYERELGIGYSTIFGMKKTVFNSVDFGAIVITTYAVRAA